MDIFFIISVGHLVRHSNIFCRTFIRNVRLSDRSDEFRHHWDRVNKLYPDSHVTVIFGWKWLRLQQCPPNSSYRRTGRTNMWSVRFASFPAILLKPLTKAYDRRSSGDSVTSGILSSNRPFRSPLQKLTTGAHPVTLSPLVYCLVIDHFGDIPMHSQTTDITHFTIVFHYGVTIKAVETLQNTATLLMTL